MDDHHHQQAADGSYNWSPMWAPAASKRKLEYDSWEERAFAEDAAGLLGSGCVWPPRSYTCSFCRREFRSAQALGGHMNVHRRDRARLKQLPNTPQDHQSRGGGSGGGGGGGGGGGFLDSPFLLKVDPNYTKCASTHNSPNPNYLFYSSSSSSNGVKDSMLSTSFVGPSNFHQQNQDHHRLNRGKRDAKLIEVLECRDHGINEGGTKCAKSELSISLSLVVRRNRPEDQDQASCFKRRKIVPAASSEPSQPLIFLSEASGVDHMSKIEIAPTTTKVHGLREIDLELRLGG